MIKIGKVFRTLRLKIDLSQEKIAHKLDISTSAYCKIETGLTDINTSRLFQLAALFEKDVIQIINLARVGEEISDANDCLKAELAYANKLLIKKNEEINVLQKKLIEYYETEY